MFVEQNVVTFDTCNESFCLSSSKILSGLIQLDQCEWRQCLDPSIPPSKNLSLLTTETDIELHDNITISCLPNNWFYHDRNLRTFSVQCLENNTFDYPTDWYWCVSGKDQEVYF